MDSISLSELPSPDDSTRRDQWGRYLVVPPTGGKPVGYTRVTTVAKTLDGGGGLGPWKATMCAIGLMLRPGLRARWEQLINEHGGDPWYGSELSKKACKKLVEECAAVGGSNDRAEQGVSLHALTALVDVGRTPQHLTAETERDLTAYVNGLAYAGISIVPDMVEVTVVLDDWTVAGTFDRLLRVPGFDLPLIGDLKTGQDLTYSWHSIATQLAPYSRANAIYKQGAAKDGSQDQRVPMPEVDQDTGVVMWLDAGSSQLELFLVDLNGGWEAFTHSMWTRAWRKARPFCPLGEELPGANDAGTPDDLFDLLKASVEQVEQSKPTPIAPIIPRDLNIAPAEPGEVRAWLQQRIDIIGSNTAARSDLAASWPLGMPTLNASTAHTELQLDQIEAVLDGVEARCSIPFGTSKPGTEAAALGRVLSMFPNSTLINGAPS